MGVKVSSFKKKAVDTMHVARDINMKSSQPLPCGRVFTAEWEGGCKQIITAV